MLQVLPVPGPSRLEYPLAEKH